MKATIPHIFPHLQFRKLKLAVNYNDQPERADRRISWIIMIALDRKQWANSSEGGGEDACSASGNFSFVIGMSLRLAGIRAGRKQIRVPTLSNMKGREIAVALGNGNCERNSSCVVHESWIIDIPLSRGGGTLRPLFRLLRDVAGGGGHFRKRRDLWKTSERTEVEKRSFLRK